MNFSPPCLAQFSKNLESVIERVIFESKHVASFWDMASRDVYRSKVSKFVGL